MAVALQPPVSTEAFAWGYNLAAASASRFHDEAHAVVARSWWHRRSHKSMPDEEFEKYKERMAELEGEELSKARFE